MITQSVISWLKMCAFQRCLLKSETSLLVIASCYCFLLLLVLRCFLALANHLPLHLPVAATSWAFLACSLSCVPLMD
ncbi:hypothetical protein [Photorhabdus luminescens]|uniref:hypothetical protein n=1 Tax=Photorhabdus luminescens TaxID=29488 RepID=UPI0011327C4F|nr:hypothetical protein [Photorhabdus luminescens]